MKYQLETIPVSDAWSSTENCPLCFLMDKAENRHVEYYLGNSVMNPETRVRVNKTGFCTRHFPMMAHAGHAHHLGLIGHTHIMEVRKQISGVLNTLERNSSPRSIRSFSEWVSKVSQQCLICNSLQKDLQRYAYTAVILYRDEEEFRRLFHQSRGPCLPHAAQLASMAEEVLKKDDTGVFIKALCGHLEKELEQLEADILHFTRKFDSQNDSLEWGESRNAHIRVVQMLSGCKIN